VLFRYVRCAALPLERAASWASPMMPLLCGMPACAGLMWRRMESWSELLLRPTVGTQRLTTGMICRFSRFSTYQLWTEFCLLSDCSAALA
jgi:hypothetical protein